MNVASAFLSLPVVLCFCLPSSAATFSATAVSAVRLIDVKVTDTQIDGAQYLTTKFLFNDSANPGDSSLGGVSWSVEDYDFGLRGSIAGTADRDDPIRFTYPQAYDVATYWSGYDCDCSPPSLTLTFEYYLSASAEVDLAGSGHRNATSSSFALASIGGSRVSASANIDSPWENATRSGRVSLMLASGGTVDVGVEVGLYGEAQFTPVPVAPAFALLPVGMLSLGLISWRKRKRG